MHLQSARPGVIDVREQVLFKFGRHDKSNHWFDMVVTKTDGKRIAYTVKPTSELKFGRFIAHMQIVASWVAKKNFASSVRLLTEQDINPVDLHNANIKIAARDQDPIALRSARAVVSDLRGYMSIKALTDALGLEARGYRAILQMIAAGELIPPQGERITPATLVSRKEYAV